MSETHPYNWAVVGPPIGIWRSALGTFAMIMADTLTIREDGTGVLESHGVFSGTEPLELVWRHLSPGAMQVVRLYDGLLQSEITEDLWEPINYIADWQTSDLSDREPILKNKHHDDFWTLTAPLELVNRDER